MRRQASTCALTTAATTIESVCECGWGGLKNRHTTNVEDLATNNLGSMSVRRRGEEGWGPGDLLTMVLVRWQFARLLHFTRLVVAVMDECGDFGESLFSETTEIESRHQGGSSFHRYYTDVMGCASSTPYPSAS
jgi:hypothetical protein